MVSCKKNFRGWWDLLLVSLPLWQRRACRLNDGEAFAMPRFLREQNARKLRRRAPLVRRLHNDKWIGSSRFYRRKIYDPCRQGDWAGSRLVCGGNGDSVADRNPLSWLEGGRPAVCAF